MNLIKLLLVTLVVFGNESVGAQEPEKYPLWPNGARESNGMKAAESVNEKGSVANNSTAELFVYRPQPAENTGMTLIICPGGGYSHLAMQHEGELFARWLTKRGITAVVLKYRMPNQHNKIPLADAQRTMRWVRSRAEEWKVKTDKIGIAGFSAGGHLASTLATHFDLGKPDASDRLESFSSRPDFALLFYPVISMKNGLTHGGSRNGLLGKKPSAELIAKYSNELQVTAQTPPAFLIHSDDDTVVPPMNSVVFYQALKANKVPAVLYILPEGGHGWGLRDSFEYYPEWTALLEKWLKQM